MKATVTDALANDFRLADFKLLLPLHKNARVLLTGTHDYAFLPHLVNELGPIEALAGAGDEAWWDTTLKALHLVNRIRVVSAPTGEYDLIFSAAADVLPLRKGGTLCIFYGGHLPARPDGLLYRGTWFAFPAWPAFRHLIPDTPPGRRAAEVDFMIYPAASLRGRLSRLVPGLITRLLPRQGIVLYQRPGNSSYPSFREQLAAAFPGLPHIVAMQNLPPALYSGRLGEGNPILLFAIDDQGRAQTLVKTARYAGLPQLRAEHRQLQTLTDSLGPILSSKVIAPLAAAEIDGRTVLAYRFEHCFPFFGPRWRLVGRPNFVHTVTDWLAAVAGQTAHKVSECRFREQHETPLERLLTRGVLPDDLAGRAKAALMVLQGYREKAFSVLEHGDLGFYNFRLSDRNGRDFRVLDWGSSELDGAVLGDLCTLLISLRTPAKLAAACLGRYLDAIGWPRAQALALWLAYMARRWEELDTIRPPAPGDREAGGGVLLHSTTVLRSYLAAMPGGEP